MNKIKTLFDIPTAVEAIDPQEPRITLNEITPVKQNAGSDSV